MKGKTILYQEVSNSIKQHIIDGTYPLGSMLPTENELVELYGVSKITVRKAVQLLVDDGYVRKQSGKGTFILSNRPFNIMNRAQSYTSLLNQAGKKVETEILEVRELKETSASTSNFVYHNVYEIIRKYRIDDKDSILFKYTVSLPDNTIFDEVNEGKEFSLYSFLSSKGLFVSSIKDSFVVEKADESIVELLKLKLPYVLKRTRHSFNERGKLIEETVSYYDTESQSYELEYQV